VLARARKVAVSKWINGLNACLPPSFLRTVAVNSENIMTERMLVWFYIRFFRPVENFLKPSLKKLLGRNDHIWRALKQVRSRLLHNLPSSLKQTDKIPHRIVYPWPDRKRPFGVNVVGNFGSETGIGEAVRSSVRALKAASVPYVVNNFVDSDSVNLESEVQAFDQDNPHSVNLIHLNFDIVPAFALEKGHTYFAGRYNIGCWFWELFEFPEVWYPNFDYFNELWASSTFIQDCLSRVSPIPVVNMPLALAPEVFLRSSFDRSHFQIPNDKFVFLFVFDFDSAIERKNPLGLVEAFKRAFGGTEDVLLYLKSVHGNRHSQAYTSVRLAADGQPNIFVTDAVYTREEIDVLVHACDCYVSLHRSEGFGLPIAEAMRAAKPVIVTAYSGNMDFTTSENSFLVDYRLTQIESEGPYPKGYVWADPDLDQAAEHMVSVYQNRDAAAKRGRRARETVLKLFDPVVAGTRMKERIKRIVSM
jgi:glycosyltransferase involved in cell wall biosynthesis